MVVVIGGSSSSSSSSSSWRASKASETVLGVNNAISGICLYICMYGWYVCPLNAHAGNFFS